MKLILQTHHTERLQPRVYLLGGGKVPWGGRRLLLVTVLCCYVK